MDATDAQLLVCHDEVCLVKDVDYSAGPDCDDQERDLVCLVLVLALVSDDEAPDDEDVGGNGHGVAHDQQR